MTATLTTCHNCGEPADGGSLPVDENGDYVAVGDEVTGWAGQSACKACVALHAAAGDRCNEVLRAYFNSNEATLSKLETMREALDKIVDACHDVRDL